METKRYQKLALIAAAAGALGFGLRGLAYRVAVDEKGLLVRLHPAILVLAVLGAAVAAVLILTWIRTEKGKIMAPTGKVQALGSLCMLAGLVLTLAGGWGGRLHVLLTVLCLLSAACMGAAAFRQLQGRQPVFLDHGVLCLFLGLYLVNRYRIWSWNPQTLDTMPVLCGIVALLVYVYQMAAGNQGEGELRSWLLLGTFGSFSCLTAASGGDGSWLALGGGLYMLCGLWAGAARKREERA